MWDTEGQTGSRRWIPAAQEAGSHLVHSVQIGPETHPGYCVMGTGDKTAST